MESHTFNHQAYISVYFLIKITNKSLVVMLFFFYVGPMNKKVLFTSCSDQSMPVLVLLLTAFFNIHSSSRLGSGIKFSNTVGPHLLNWQCLPNSRLSLLYVKLVNIFKNFYRAWTIFLTRSKKYNE